VAEANVGGLWRGRALTRRGASALVLLARACAGLHPIRLAQPEPGAVAAPVCQTKRGEAQRNPTPQRPPYCQA